MASAGRPVGHRARWPDMVIALALVILAALGVMALFGGAIRAWFAEPPGRSSSPTPSAVEPTL